MIASLLAGHFGATLPLTIEKIGLILFIFSVGIQAGPGFFDAIKSREVLKWILPTFLLIILASITSIFICRIAGLDYNYALGIYSGILTNTASLAAGLEVKHTAAASVAYSITYPISMFVIILAVRLIPIIFKIDFELERAKFNEELNRKYPQVISKNYKLTNTVLHGKTIGELSNFELSGGTITRIKRGEEVFIATEEFVLANNDIIVVAGTRDNLKSYGLLIGDEVDISVELSSQNQISWFNVFDKNIINKRLKVLKLDKKFQARVHYINRSGMTFTPNSGTKLRFGDKILVEVSKDAYDKLSQSLGVDSAKDIDFLPIAGAVIIGVILSQIKMKIGDNIIFGPGITGGVLIATLVLGRIGKTGPMLWNIAGTTNRFLRQLGMLLFLSGVGVRNGSQFMSSLDENGIKIVFATLICIFVLISLLTFFIFKYIKKDKLTELGLISSCLTSAPSLQVINEMTSSPIATMSYTTLYPFALLLTIMGAQFLVIISSII